MKRFLTRISSAIAAAGLVFAAGTTQAAPVVYQGDLTSGVAAFGDYLGDSLSSSALWDFWTFSASVGDVITVTARRQTGSQDPVFAIYFGTEADTSDYPTLGSSTASTFITSADDTLGPLFPGPFGDPQATFTAASTGLYVVAIADHTATFHPALPELPYCISVVTNGSGTLDPTTCSRQAVPEPGSLSLLALALIGAGAIRRRRSA